MIINKKQRFAVIKILEKLKKKKKFKIYKMI